MLSDAWMMSVRSCSIVPPHLTDSETRNTGSMMSLDVGCVAQFLQRISLTRSYVCSNVSSRQEDEHSTSSLVWESLVPYNQVDVGLRQKIEDTCHHHW
jgi:hypothetical protein